MKLKHKQRRKVATQTMCRQHSLGFRTVDKFDQRTAAIHTPIALAKSGGLVLVSHVFILWFSLDALDFRVYVCTRPFEFVLNLGQPDEIAIKGVFPFSFAVAYKWNNRRWSWPSHVPCQLFRFRFTLWQDMKQPTVGILSLGDKHFLFT